MSTIAFIVAAVVLLFIVIYYNSSGQKLYAYITKKTDFIYERVEPYTYKGMKKKVKELGQNYTLGQYIAQVVMFAAFAGILTFAYFRSIVVSIIYAVAAVAVIPYLHYLRCKRLYSEFVFEQVQVYTTNTIMEFATTQSFVKALEGVYNSGVLEDPVKTDVKIMIDMAYENGTINSSLDYMASKYDYHIIRNMHQLFLQITQEGSKDASDSLENMSLDIDMLVEGVYRDRLDRAAFHKKFLKFGIILYGMGLLVQLLLSKETYVQMLNLWYVQFLLHAILLVNSFFLLKGEKYYNENVGAE